MRVLHLYPVSNWRPFSGHFSFGGYLSQLRSNALTECQTMWNQILVQSLSDVCVRFFFLLFKNDGRSVGVFAVKVNIFD